MATPHTVTYPDLKGADQHHDLKNRPGDDGDPDHAKSDVSPTEALKETVEETEAETQIADALRDVVSDESRDP